MASKSKIPDNEFPSDILGKLFTPDFLPEEINITDFLDEVELNKKSSEELAKSISSKNITGTQGSADDSPIPLTLEEAAEVDRQINNTLSRINVIRTQIQSIQSSIESQITSPESNQGEYTLSLDISRKPRIKRAIRQLFGIKTDKITFGMYKEMLQARNVIEQQEYSEYLSGE